MSSYIELTLSSMIFQKSRPRIKISVFKIGKVVAVGVCLALERDIIVRLFPVTVSGESERPFNEIEYIKRHEQQFTLLGSVNAFVVYDIPVNPTRIPRPKRPEQIQAYPLRHQSAFDYHELIILNLQYNCIPHQVHPM